MLEVLTLDIYTIVYLLRNALISNLLYYIKAITHHSSNAFLPNSSSNGKNIRKNSKSSNVLSTDVISNGIIIC